MKEAPGVMGAMKSEKVSPAETSCSDEAQQLPAIASTVDRISPPIMSCCPTDTVITAVCLPASGFEQLLSEKLMVVA